MIYVIKSNSFNYILLSNFYKRGLTLKFFKSVCSEYLNISNIVNKIKFGNTYLINDKQNVI